MREYNRVNQHIAPDVKVLKEQFPFPHQAGFPSSLHHMLIVQEAFSESTLELLVDDAEALLAEALAAAAATKEQEDLLLLSRQQQQDATRSSVGPSSSTPSSSTIPGHLPPLTPAVTQDGTTAAQVQMADDAATLARKAAARAVCSSLAPYEQDLCLLLAAVLRHARHASLDDPRLQVGAVIVQT